MNGKLGYIMWYDAYCYKTIQIRKRKKICLQESKIENIYNIYADRKTKIQENEAYYHSLSSSYKGKVYTDWWIREKAYYTFT